jgi:hypothetical protein
MIQLEYNISTEVSREQYALLRTKANGIVAFREDAGKFFAKLLIGRYQTQINHLLNS